MDELLTDVAKKQRYNLDPCEIKISQAYPDISLSTLRNLNKFVRQASSSSVVRSELKTKIKSFSEDIKWDLDRNLYAKLDTAAKMLINHDRMNNTKFYGDPLQAALSFYEETSSVVEGAGYNIPALQTLNQKKYMGKFLTDLRKINFEKQFISSSFDVAIRDELMFGNKYKGAFSDKVNQVVSILDSAYKKMNAEQNQSGNLVKPVKNYAGPLVHDGKKIYGNFSKWATTLTNALNMQKQFSIATQADLVEFESLKSNDRLQEAFDTDSKNQIVQILKSSYNSIVKDEISNTNLQPTTMSARRARARTFTEWKDAESYTKYLQEFSEYPSLYEQLMHYSNRAARDMAIANVIGSDFGAGHTFIETTMVDQLRQQGASSSEVEAARKELNTSFNLAVKPYLYGPPSKVNPLVKAFSTANKWSSLPLLGKSGATSAFLDPLAQANQRRILLGENVITSMFNATMEYMNAIPEAWRSDVLEQKYILDQHQLSSTFEEMMGLSSSGKYHAAATEFVAKVSLGNFANRVAHVAAAKQWYYELSKIKNISDLKKTNPNLLANLNKFNITQTDIELVKKLKIESYGMLNINKLTGDELAIFDPSKANLTSEERDAFIMEFQQKMGLWALEQIKKGAPMPGVREKRILLGGTSALTAKGEFVRALATFKSMALKTGLDSSIGASRSINPQGFQVGGPDMYNWKTISYMGNFAFNAFLAGMGLLATNALIEGLAGNDKQIKRFEKKDPTLLSDAFIRGGGLYLMGDLVTMGKDPMWNVAGILGPAFLSYGKHLQAGYQLTHGKPGKALKTEAKNLIPAANHWLIGSFIEGFDRSLENHTSSSSETPLK